MGKNRTYHPRGELVDGYAPEDHPLYVTWADMLARCTNQKVAGWGNYGGRGISVCERWHHFRFFAADMGPKPFPEASIDRIDNNGNYEPDNCRWATRSEQCANRRMFSNNTSGATGVTKKDGSWVARFDFEGERYNIGWFATYDEAVVVRASFVELFFADKAKALAMLPKDKARHTSRTGVRGVTPHADGFGYTVRVTHNKERLYLGYFPTLDEAVAARERFLFERDSGAAITINNADTHVRRQRRSEEELREVRRA